MTLLRMFFPLKKKLSLDEIYTVHADYNDGLIFSLLNMHCTGGEPRRINYRYLRDPLYTLSVLRNVLLLTDRGIQKQSLNIIVNLKFISIVLIIFINFLLPMSF